MTDLDLPPIARTQANYWKAMYFKSLHDLAAANRGIGRLKRRVVILTELVKTKPKESNAIV